MVDNKNIGLDMYARKINMTTTMVAASATASDVLYTILKENSKGYPCDIIGSNIFINVKNPKIVDLSAPNVCVVCSFGKINSFNCITSISLTAINKHTGVLHEITIPFEDIFVDNRANKIKFNQVNCTWETNPSLNDINALLHTVELYISIWN